MKEQTVNVKVRDPDTGRPIHDGDYHPVIPIIDDGPVTPPRY